MKRFDTLGDDESEWVLQDIQKGNRAQDAFMAHIKAGVDHAAADPAALLIFSGGETRVGEGPRMEGTSYFVGFFFWAATAAHTPLMRGNLSRSWRLRANGCRPRC